MCVRRNEVRFLTDAERKYTPGQEGVASHVKPCFCSGERPDGSRRENPPGKEKVCHMPASRRGKDRDGWCEDKN